MTRLLPSSLSTITLITLSLGLWGCPEDITAVDFGAPESDSGVSGESAGGEINEGCVEDEQCDRGEYCRLSGDLIMGECVEGCRVEPNSCARPGSRKVCDEETRTCVLSCEADSDCYDEQYCAEGVCETGCRILDEHGASNCPPSADAPQRCDEESRECRSAEVCCDLDDQCSIQTARSCERGEGEVLYGLLSCEPDPCTRLCDLDSQCEDNEYCADYGRCKPGCRVSDPSGCPADLACDPESRLCTRQSCDDDAACPEWQYCGADGRCADGCRADGCPEGLRCDERHVCRVFCAQDDECAEGEYCDASSERCRPACDPATHSGCESGEACVEGRCAVGCADDPRELAGDDTLESATDIEWTVGAVGQARQSALLEQVLCDDQVTPEEDWFRFELAAGERVELILEAQPGSGPLELSLLNSEGDAIAVSDLWARQQTLRYPELGAGAPAGDYWVRVRDAGLIEPHLYTLKVNVSDTEDACFLDAYDPIDNTVNGARLIGLTPALRFTEEMSGDLCSGDRDHFCFPMTLSDGLDLYLEAPASCDPLEVTLAPSTVYNLPPASFSGYTLTQEERAPDAPYIYQIELDPETSAFSNDEWCARVASEGQCEGYRMSATFSRRQLVCSDPREPNNAIAQALELDGSGPLGDGQGEIPQNIPVTLNENLVLCPGDLDLFSVRSDAGDAWRAWIVDDSDRPDAEEQGRGELIGELRVRFLNSDGVPVGDSASINPPTSPDMEAEELEFATAVSPSAESLFIEVSGVESSSGPYKLMLLRVPSTGACSQDINEPEGGDDELNPVSRLSEDTPGRLTVNNGYLCDPADELDEDWFTFEVQQANTRLCLNSTFRHRNGDINVELFEAGNVNEGQLCEDHAACRAEQSGSSCINRRCRAPVARANSLDDGELIHFSSLETQPGRYYARVYSPAPAENAYQLAVTLVPPSDECEPDIHEGVSGNNRAQDATRFGSGRVELCDTWLCANERTEGDWFEIVVPGGAQRTVHVAFETQQGRLTLSAEDASAIDGQIIESPRSQSRNVHCINIAAGARPATVRLHVGGDVFNLNQTRVDYLLRVVPTDLNSSARGACDLLSGGLFNDVTWPLLNLGL